MTLAGACGMQFNLQTMFAVVTLCGIEAALIAATSTTPVAVVPALLLGYYLLTSPVAVIVVWRRSARTAPLDEVFALCTIGLVQVVAWGSVCLVALVLLFELFELILTLLQ